MGPKCILKSQKTRRQIKITCKQLLLAEFAGKTLAQKVLVQLLLWTGAVECWSSVLQSDVFWVALCGKLGVVQSGERNYHLQKPWSGKPGPPTLPGPAIVKVPPARRLWGALCFTRHFDSTYLCGFSQQNTACPLPFGHAAVRRYQKVSEQPRLKGHRGTCNVSEHKATSESVSRCHFPCASAMLG